MTKAARKGTRGDGRGTVGSAVGSAVVVVAGVVVVILGRHPRRGLSAGRERSGAVQGRLVPTDRDARALSGTGPDGHAWRGSTTILRFGSSPIDWVTTSAL